MKITIDDIFVKNVNAILKKKDWTGYRLALNAGVNPSTVTRMLAMKHSTSLDVVEKIAVALGTTASKLLKN